MKHFGFVPATFWLRFAICLLLRNEVDDGLTRLLFLRNKMNGDLNQDRLDGLEVLVIIDERGMLQIRSYKRVGVFLGRNGIFILTSFLPGC